jgi:hypothetical protein
VTGRRLKLIAAQAVVVGALLIVVSLTLLRPEDGNPLFDVVAPGASEISVGTASSQPAQRDPASGRAQGDPREPDAGAQVAPGTVNPPLGLVPGPSPVPQAPSAPGYEGEDPTEAQYADTLTRLAQQLR